VVNHAHYYSHDVRRVHAHDHDVARLRAAAIAHYQAAYELFESHRYDLGEGVKPL
jgi:hypothetical protein